MEDELIEAGYTPGVPSPDCLQDAEIVLSYPCEHCGGQMRFRPYMKRLGSRNVWTNEPNTRYRAFAYCPTCETWEAF